MLIEAGEDLYTVKEVLGPKQIQTTTTRYAHLQLSKKAAPLKQARGYRSRGTPAVNHSRDYIKSQKKAPSFLH